MASPSPTELNTLLARINTLAQAYIPPSTNSASPASNSLQQTFQTTSTPRHALLTAAKALVLSLSDPEEEVWKFILQPNAHACLITAWECGILRVWEKERMSARELAVLGGADEKLVGECAFQIQEVIRYAVWRVALFERRFSSIWFNSEEELLAECPWQSKCLMPCRLVTMKYLCRHVYRK